MNQEIFKRPPLPQGLLSGKLRVEQVLYEAEAPVLFLTSTEQGQQLLALVIADNDNTTSTLLAPTTEKIIEELRQGHVSVRDALTSSWMWLLENNPEHNGLWRISPTDVDRYLPLQGTLLFPELLPVLKTRALGEQIRRGHMPASVIAFVADSTRKAVKTLLDQLLATPSGGRPTENHRALYDLPVQSFQFASFEVSFAAPDDGSSNEQEVKQAVQKLEKGLRWASEAGNGPFSAASNTEKEVILRAALLLTPPSGGAIDEVQVSGAWIQNETIKLTREARRRVRQELRSFDSEQVVRHVGRVGEVDADNLSFMLREIDDKQDRKGWFDQDLLDELIDLLGSSERIAVAGVERSGKLYVSAVSRVAHREE